MKPHRRRTSSGLDGDDLLDVIASIYESALDLSHWRITMHKIAHALGGHRALMFVPDLNVQGFWAAHDIQPDMMAGYQEHYRQVDVWTNRCHPHLNTNGATTLGEIVIPEREYERSEFWNDFTRPADIFRIAAVAVDIADNEPERGTLLSVYRPRASQPFEDDARLLLHTLQPHIRRSLTIGKLLAGAAAERAYLEAMLDAVATPMFACTGDGRIAHANAAAEVLLRENDGLISEGTRLVAPTLAASEKLRRGIAMAASMKESGGHHDLCTLELPRRDGVQHLTVNVAPLARQRPGEFSGQERPAVLVAVQQQTSIDLAQSGLGETYGLTDAEVRLLDAMLRGGALPAVARRLGIRHTTARTHLMHIFEKTQTHRQAELLQLIRGFVQ
jgi:DNA-binding CsgD family transcriptional regulator